MDRTLQEVGGKQFSEFKPILAECAVEILSPISREMTRLMQNADEMTLYSRQVLKELVKSQVRFWKKLTI